MTAREAHGCIGYRVMYRGEDLEIVAVRKYRQWMFVLSSGAIIKPEEIR